MLVEAISCDEGSHSYEFSQISELLECLWRCKVLGRGRGSWGRGSTPPLDQQHSRGHCCDRDGKLDFQSTPKPPTGSQTQKHIHVPHFTWFIQ